MDANAGQVIGAGNAGRPLFQKFQRTGATGILNNPGCDKYDPRQTSLTRRMAQGVQVNVAYTRSKAFGICCDTLSDGSPRVQALGYDLNRSSCRRIAPTTSRPRSWRSCRCEGKPFLSNGVPRRSSLEDGK